MKKIKIAICDDEKDFVEKLKIHIISVMNKYNYKCSIKEFFDGALLVEHCAKNPPDIILIDIDMPSMSGFEAVSAIQKQHHDTDVIFVTAHEEYSYQAYDYRPYNFVKKTDKERLDNVLVSLCEKICSGKENNTQVSIKLDKTIDISVSDIMLFESKRNYVLMRDKDNTVVKIRGSIKSVYNQLKAYGFVCVNRSYVVNCRFIEDFKTNVIILKNGTAISLTRDEEKKHEAQSIYLEFIRSKSYEPI